MMTQLQRYASLACCAVAAVMTAVGLTSGFVEGGSEAIHQSEQSPIIVEADVAHEWKDGNVSVLVMRGHCRIAQRNVQMQAQKVVLWRKTEKNVRGTIDHLDVYLEDDVHIDTAEQSVNLTSKFVSLETRHGVELNARHRLAIEPATQDGLFQRALSRRRDTKRAVLLQTQLVVEDDPTSGPELQVMPLEPQQGQLRRVRIFPRNTIPYSVLSFESRDTTPAEQVWVLTGGIRMVVDGLERFNTVDLAADRMVIWTESLGEGGFRADPGETFQTSDAPLTVYMEGNIVMRQGQNVVRATHGTVDVRENRALYHNVELRAFVPQLNGDLRIRAERVRQLSQSRFHAQQAWATGSKFGRPGYRVLASDIIFEERYTQPWVGAGTERFDPDTGAPIVEETHWITSLNNTFLVEEVPLLYTPYLSAPADDPGIPLRRIQAKYDNIFGGQLKTAWDMFKVLGLDAPEGTTWDLLADYYSQRGPAAGTATDYHGNNLFGNSDRFRGEGLLYFVHDDGDDNLGFDRRELTPDTTERYRATWRHRHDLPEGLTVFGELGLISDRNFLEQYFENDFDKDKDEETLIGAQQIIDNWAWSALARPQVNDFETTTEWLPRGDLYGLSEPLLGGLLTWSSHTSAAYANLRPGESPTDPLDIYTPLPYVADVGVAVLMSRHEVDAPFSLGPLHVVPYAMGEGAFWSEDFAGDELDRVIGQAGIRSSILAWRVYPYVRSRIFNLNGLAHKILFEADYSFTDSSEGLAGIPQYNEFDDDAQERFRNRFLTNTFGGTLPPVVEPRFYAVRTGAGSAVTVPYHELIDDQQVARFAIRQRLQTKEGPPDHMRIKDWMILDLEAAYFPDSDRDNFGEDLGLLGARYRWNVGSRTSILANASYDVFDGAQELWNVGVLSQRSTRGSVYLGVRQIKAAGIESQIVTASYTYQMSPKWISTFGTAYDFGEGRNAGQSLTITRVGADFLVHFGANYDESKDSAGIALAVEPRFARLKGSQTKLGSLLQDQQTNR
ncbi:MAG: hypothetical protein WD648_15505 [Planctomycetaceae bacterium]